MARGLEDGGVMRKGGLLGGVEGGLVEPELLHVLLLLHVLHDGGVGDEVGMGPVGVAWQDGLGGLAGASRVEVELLQLQLVLQLVLDLHLEVQRLLGLLLLGLLVLQRRAHRVVRDNHPRLAGHCR